MAQEATPGYGWFKSSLSFANGNCVEVQMLTDGGVQVRNSREADGGTLTFTAAEWSAFLGGAKKGEFDLPETRKTQHDPDKPPKMTVMDQNSASGWFKSSFSAANNCVEVRHSAEGTSVRNSRDPQGPSLTFTPGEWTAFTAGVRGGEFDR